MVKDEGRWKLQGLPMAIHCLIARESDHPHFGDSHYHDYIELLWGLKGKTEVFISGEIHCFGEGELLILNSKEPHALRSQTPSSEYIVVKFLPQLIYSGEESVFEIKYIVPFLLSQANHPRILKADDPLSGKAKRRMEAIWKEWQRQEYGFELNVRGNILILFSTLLRSWHRRNLIGNEISDVPAQTLAQITKAIEYASKHLEEADEQSVAAVAGFSPAYFSRSFTRIMHMNFATYLTLLRLNKAERLLATTDLSVTEIAGQVGYSTASHFSFQFKKQKHCTPSAFRSLMGKAGKREDGE